MVFRLFVFCKTQFLYEDFLAGFNGIMFYSFPNEKKNSLSLPDQ